jgi:hypothetical protein
MEVATRDALLGIEHELARGKGDVYRRHLAQDAVVIVPGASLDKEETVAAMDASPGWDEYSFEDEVVEEPRPGTVILTYRFSGRRAETAYSALLTSIYLRDPRGRWELRLHQQTVL